MKIVVGVFVTHPIQYQAPLWRALASEPSLDLTVYYFSDQGVASRVDPGFGKAISWDVPLLEGYRYEFLSRKPIEKADSFSIPAPARFFESHRFDVVLLHGYTHRFARQLLRRAKRCRFKIVLRGEFTEMQRQRRFWRRIAREPYLKWFYSRVNHFCPIGTDALEHLKRHKIPDERMTITPYSVDDQLLSAQKGKFNRKSCRRELGIKDDDVVFLFSGKMIPRKDPLLVVEAAEHLRNNDKLVLLFLGDGPLLPELRERLGSCSGLRYITPGFVNQSELGKYFRAADVFVLPSEFDTWGLVVNEAMHFELPCIVSDRVGAGRDLIVAGHTGYVFPYRDVGALADGMSRFLAQPDLAKKMGSNGYEHIQKFTIERTVKGLVSAIQKAAEESQPGGKALV